MTPYLQLLLNRKRNDPTVPYDDPNDPGVEQDERLPSGPTIALSKPRQSTLAVAPQPTNAIPDEATYPLRLPVTNESPPELPATVRLGARIAQDQRDVATAQSHHHSKARDVLEGLGQYVGSGIGLNIHKLIYPRGTETEKAQRQLATDVGLQKVATDNADTQSTIALRSAQVRKIDADLNNPDTSDEDKRKLQVAGEILKSHPQPFDPNDPADAVAIEKLNAVGIPIPKSYGKTPTQREPLLKERKKADGSTVTMRSDDLGKTWIEVPALASEAPATETAGAVPDTTAPWIEKERIHREQAKNANKAAEEAEASVEAWQKANPGKDPLKEGGVDVARAVASARRLRETEKTENQNANEAYNKRIEAANKDAENRAKVKMPGATAGQPSPTTHILNKKAWLQSHPESDWPKAVKTAKSLGYQIVE